MQNYDHKTLNYNDYSTTRSSSISTSTSTSTIAILKNPVNNHQQ